MVCAVQGYARHGVFGATADSLAHYEDMVVRTLYHREQNPSQHRYNDDSS